MKADTPRKRLSRSGCPSAHFLLRRGAVNCFGLQGSSRMSRAGMLGESAGHNFEADLYCAVPGLRKSEWDVC